jgi:AcrR family transcriptional regulator
MTVERNRDVDAHVRRLWRHRGTTPPSPRRGPSGRLDLEDLLAAGIAIADAGGLNAVSIRAVAARFGVTAMALYPYVGTKEQLLALMQDHACAPPAWDDPATGLAADLGAWADALASVYLAHPWLADRPWTEATQGPNEQDWSERLLAVLERWAVPVASRPSALTMLYATVRACAGTAAAYRRLDEDGAAAWRNLAGATIRQVPDLAARYPHSTALPPLTPHWRDNPLAALAAGVRLLAAGLNGPMYANRIDSGDGC